MSDKETFIPGLGTVRECRHCGALIAGGPTSCIRCAEEGPPKRKPVFRIPQDLRENWELLIPLVLFILFMIAFFLAAPYIAANFAGWGNGL
jgi:hypothetical protein